MARFEALLEINQEQVENLADYITYCKYYFKPKSEEKVEDYLFKNRNRNIYYLDRNKKETFLKEFSYLKVWINKCIDERNANNRYGNANNRCENKLASKLKDSKYKPNETLKDFPLNWLKYEIIGNNKGIEFESGINVKNIIEISGIYEKDDLSNLQSYIEKLPKYSFAIWFKFKLKAPYFSKDDDEFYIIQNPILKETNFKVPMIRGSAWKGALAHAFRELFKENYEGNKDKIESFLRIFGAGSESIKAIERYIFDKRKNLKEAQNKLLEFILFELGLEVNKDLIESVKNTNNKEQLIDILKNNLSKKMTEGFDNLPLEFQTHKGRAIFYPTYFDRLSLEIINPHDRRKRAGKNPIHYEVVPAGTEGIFQLIYIPFDAVLKRDDKIKKEVEEDLRNIISALKLLEDKGIGAKTKLGWGRFEILEKKVCIKSNLNTETPKGWEICQD